VKLNFLVRHLAHSSPNFDKGSKSAKFNLASVSPSTPLAFEPYAFHNGARYLKSKTKCLNAHNDPTSSPHLVHFSPHIPDAVVGAPTLKIGQQKS